MLFDVSQPHTQVPEIDLRDDGSISLTVEVFGFDVGTIVEISGHATQANGAIATFYTVQELPPASSGHGSLVMAIAIPAAKFVEGEVITVAGQARVVKTWGTVLDGNPGDPVWKARPET
jgi:hypothetical protein